MLAGTALRLLLGLAARPWQGQPDQLAWQLMLDAPGLRPDQLLHYPHEGGTLVMSLLALAAPTTVLPGLSVAALAWDTVLRAGQVAAAAALFGTRTALLFAAWTVVAVPMLLPWGTVNVGLHHAASLWPFLVLWALDRRRWLLGGVLMGLALLFSYNSLVLLVLPLVLAARDPRALLAFMPASVVVAGGHVLRRGADLGFQLERLSAWSIRGESVGASTPADAVLGLWSTWGDVLPQGLFSRPFGGGEPGGAWVFVAVIGAALAAWRGGRAARLAALVVLTTTVLYGLSPFAELPRGYRDYFAYRHLAYVLPLLACLALHGWSRRRAVGLAVLAAAVVASCVSLTALVPVPPAPPGSVGWILGRKLGHHPERLQALVGDDRQLLEGIGVGMAVAVHRAGGASPEQGARRLVRLVDRFTPVSRPDVVAGIRRAYDVGADPPLDPALRDAFDDASWLGRVELEGALVERRGAVVVFDTIGRARLAIDGQAVLVLSGTLAEGRGPHVLIGDRVVPIGVERQAVRVTGDEVVVVYQDDLVDAEGNDRGLILWWIGGI